MLGAFDVVVPTLDRRLPGVLRPVAGPCAGVLLLDATGAQVPLVSRLYAELELYFQTIDIVTLRLSLAPGVKIGKRVSGVLGGVSLLHSMGATRVLLITSAFDPLATREEVSAGTLDSLVDLAVQGHALPEIMQIVRDLTATIRDVADSVIGVATLLARPGPADVSYVPPRPLKRPVGPVGPVEMVEMVEMEDGVVPTASPPALLLPLPADGDPHGTQAATAQLLTQLYSWSLALAHPERETKISRALLPETGAARESEAARANWFIRRRWMDEQWEELLDQLALRAPVRAARARASGEKRHGKGDGWSLRASRDAWAHLDGEARVTWLQDCSKGFLAGGLDSIPATDPSPASLVELTELCSC